MVQKYRKGADYERQIAANYRASGWLAIRSAGSKSPIDLVCIHPELKCIRVIQCKAGKISNKEKERILESGKAFEGDYSMEFILI